MKILTPFLETKKTQSTQNSSSSSSSSPSPSAMDLHSSPTILFQNIQSLFKKEIIYALSFLFILYLNLTVPFQPQSLFQTSLSSKFSPKNQNLDTQDCDYSKGKWVRDENNLVGSYDERCQFLDPGFRCHQNGRKDDGYLKWRWQPDECDLPRFNASELLERTRNGRIVFAGDSIGRNQWESLICMLAKAVSNQTNIYEQNGNPITKHKGYLSIRFHEYNLTVEYYRVPFLVTRDHPPQNYSNKVRSTIRVDHLHWRSEQWVGADILIFNAGHWWNKDKTVKMGCYFQEGGTVNMTMNVMEAFRRSLETWRLWVIQSTDPKNSYIFFRSYSPVHYREGTWNDGGRCDYDKEPETNYNKLDAEPWNNMFIYETIEKLKDVKRNVQFLNITYLTEFRNDGHPSIHREAGTPVPFLQDCSHWCLPGVPDTWNKLLYAHLLSKDYRTQNSRKV